jgi:hypothetical protein
VNRGNIAPKPEYLTAVVQNIGQAPAGGAQIYAGAAGIAFLGMALLPPAEQAPPPPLPTLGFFPFLGA